MADMHLTSAVGLGGLPFQVRFNGRKTVAVLERKQGASLEQCLALNYATVLHALEEIGLKEVDAGALRDGMAHATEGRPLVVARGQEPEDGEDGSLEYAFEPNVAEQVWRDDNSLKIDFRKRNEINNIRAGDVLVELVPGTDGIPGVDVFGASIPAKKGRPARMVAGKNVRLSEDGEQAYATADGCVKVVRSRIVVDTRKKIRGNVDFRSGSIEFNGDVNVRGDVNETFSVEATGSITVGGLVDRAALKAGGDIIINAGIFGKEDVRVEAEGNISCRFAENAELIAGGSIYVTGALVYCTVRAGEKLWLKARDKALIGGHVYAVHGIEAYSLGNPGLPTRTLVEFGGSPDIARAVRLIKAQLRQADEQRTHELRAKLEALKEASQAQIHAQAIARSTIYPGVVLLSAGVTLDVKEPLTRVTIYRGKGASELSILRGAPPMPETSIRKRTA